MNRDFNRLVVCSLALTLASLATDATAQSFGGSTQRGTQRSGGTGAAPGGNRSGSSGGFNIQVGPGGVQFGAGNNPPNSNLPNQPGSGGFNNNPNNNPNNWNNNNNNWNNNPNNWNGNNWNQPRRPSVIIQPVPVIRVPSLPTPPAEPILLINPAGTQTTVYYRVNQYSYVLAPGQTQQLDGSTAWTIDYHRGGDFGRTSYALTPGRTYRFTPGQRGWDLFVVQPEAPPVIGQ